jgi:hypothetical protein
MPFFPAKSATSNRTSIGREVLELAIAAAVKQSDPQCEAFVGILVEHTVPKSHSDSNWVVKGIQFGKADRDKCTAAVATVVERMQQEFELSKQTPPPRKKS